MNSRINDLVEAGTVFLDAAQDAPEDVKNAGPVAVVGWVFLATMDDQAALIFDVLGTDLETFKEKLKDWEEA